MIFVFRRLGAQRNRIAFKNYPGIETHQNPKYANLGNPRNDIFEPSKMFRFCSNSQKPSQTNHRKISESEYLKENPRLFFGSQASRMVKLENPRFFSSLLEHRNTETQRTVSINVLVRSMVSIIQKTDKWDSLLSSLCAVSSSQITPRIAVQVLKRIKKPDIAFKFFEWLEDRNGFKHDSLTYSAVLKVLTKNSNPSHASIAEDLLHKEINLGFEVTPSDFDIVLQQWVRVKKIDKALALLDEMKSHGFVPGPSACNVLLQQLVKSKNKDLGWDLFYEMVDGKIDSLDTQTFNIMMKDACVGGRIEEAVRIFSLMKQRDCMPDLDSFNILIKGFSEKGHAEMICSLFKQMLDFEVKPDSYTMNLLIKELCKQGRPELGNDLFNYMRKVGWIDRKFVYTQLVDSLCDYGWWLKALKIFTKMIRRGHRPNIDLYNNIVRRLCMGGRIRAAYKLKDLVMAKKYIPDMENYNALMEGVCLAGKMDMAERLLREFQHKGLDPDLRTWTVVLLGYCAMGKVKAALEIMENIKLKGWQPDYGPCNLLITKLMIDGKVEEAMQVKIYIEMDQNINSDTYAVMITELNKLDCVNEATKLITEMVVKDLHPGKAIYGTVIEGHCRRKNIKDAQIIFDEMVSRGCKPDNQIYASLFEALCSVGRIPEALVLWEEMMSSGYQFDVSTLSPAVHKLCIDGNLNEAEQIIHKMFEYNMRPDKEIFEAFFCNLFSAIKTDIHPLFSECCDVG